MDQFIRIQELADISKESEKTFTLEDIKSAFYAGASRKNYHGVGAAWSQYKREVNK